MTLLPLLMMQGRSWWPSLLILIVICFIVVSLNFFIIVCFLSSINVLVTPGSDHLTLTNLPFPKESA